MPRRGENIRKRKDGRWEGRYIKGRSVYGQAVYGSVYGKSYLDVKQKLSVQSNKAKKQELSDQLSCMTFREILFLWLANSKIKLRSQTYAKYFSMIENHLADSIGRNKLSKIGAPIINSFLESKIDNGRKDGKGGLSTSYVKTLGFIIQAAHALAVQLGYCQPLSGDIFSPSRKKVGYMALSVEEQKRLENYVMEDMDGYKLGILLCLHTGLRIGELCGLQWNDIDVNERLITVSKSLQRVKNLERQKDEPKTFLKLVEPKTLSSYRSIPIPSYLISVLEKYMSSPFAFVIADATGDCTDPRTYQNHFKRYLKDCLLPDVNFHALRHSFATRCIEVGMDVKSLSELLGHASVNITLNTYVHSSLEQKRNQVELLRSIRGQ